MKICITGAPKTGKTTLACAMLCNQLYHCDDYINMGWSESSAYAAGLMAGAHSSWLMEGVQVPRALRKFIEAHPGVKPCDRLVILRNEPYEPPTPGRRSMAKSIETVLAEILPEMRRLGVEIEERR